MSEFTQLSFSQSNLVYYNTNAANPGIFIEWERYTLSGVYSYKIFRSDYFDGTYTEIDEVLFPINEYVDGGGSPSSFYKIQEIGNDLTTVLSTSAPINGDELLIKSSLRFELEHLLNIPIYDEEVLFRRGRSQATVAFPFWNFYPRPEVRITGSSNEGDQDAMFTLSEYDPIYKTINPDYDPILYSRDGTITNYASGNNYSDGLKYKCDYMGNIYFVKSDGTPQTIQSYDTVFVSYNVKAFTSQHMNSSLNMALQVINAQPGASKYPSIASVPYYYDPALVFGAAY